MGYNFEKMLMQPFTVGSSKDRKTGKYKCITDEQWARAFPECKFNKFLPDCDVTQDKDEILLYCGECTDALPEMEMLATGFINEKKCDKCGKTINGATDTYGFFRKTHLKQINGN